MNDCKFLIYGAGSSLCANEILNKNKSKIIVFQCDAILPFSQNNNIILKTFEDFLSEKECYEINEYIKNNYGENFIDKEIKFSSYNNIEFGKYFYNNYRGKLITILRNMICIEKIIKNYNPSFFYLSKAQGINLHIWKDKIQGKRIPFELLNEDRNPEVTKEWTPIIGQSKKSQKYFQRLRQGIFKIKFIITKEFYLSIGINKNLKKEISQLLGYTNINPIIRFNLSIRKLYLKYIFNKRLKKLKSDFEQNKYFRFKNHFFYPYIKKELKKTFILFPRTIIQYKFYLFIMKIFKPKFILTKVSASKNVRLLIDAGKKACIPVIQWNSQFSNSQFSNILPSITGDYVLIWAKHHKEFIKQNKTRPKIFPYSQNLNFTMSHAIKGNYKKEDLGFSINKKNILFIDSNFQEAADAKDSPLDVLIRHIDAFICMAKIHKKYNFIIKLHPGIGSPKTEGFFAAQKRVNYIEKESINNLYIAPLDTSISQYMDIDLVVSYYSTVCMEFMDKNKLALIINFSNKRGCWPLKNNSDKLITVHNKKEFMTFLNNIFSIEEYQKKHLEYQKKIVENILYKHEDSFISTFKNIIKNIQ